MELKLYNTLTRTKGVFKPLDELSGRPPADWRVRMYVCGPTVYDRAHIGNARPVIVFDVLFRLLRHLYGPDHVTYVRNITDIDDKINARAAERGVPIRQLTDETYEWFKQDVKALGCLEPTHEPRATEYIAPMIKMIEALIATGHAYPAEGHVLFDVSSKPDYGKLSNRSVDDMIAGARVEVAPYKKNPMDFVLWKPSTSELPGWDSPWGRGRPGWHIECSAMGKALLGETFDIHGGGIDLVFPHHENEIAQSECVHHGAPLAKVWMHNGFVQMEGEKMAKSEGNVVTIRELLSSWRGQSWRGESIRFAMLSTHYRQPMDWTETLLKNSLAVVDEWRSLWGKVMPYEISREPSSEVLKALSDDLNTPLAIAHLHKIAGRARTDRAAAAELLNNAIFLGVETDILEFGFAMRKLLEGWGEQLTRYQKYYDKPIYSRDYEVIREIFEKVDVNRLIETRQEAKSKKHFQLADNIRKQLGEHGVILKDGPNGTTTWEVAR